MDTFKCIKCLNILKISDKYKSAGNTCKCCHKKWRKEYYQKNKNKIKTQVKEYDKVHPENLKNRITRYYKKSPKKHVYNPDYYRKMYYTNWKYKLARTLRDRTQKALKSKKFNKRNSLKEYLGCTLDELKTHLEKQFQPGMTWDNHGKWHIDHIIPLSSANSPEEMTALCHYTNLQPLWAEDNLRKFNKIG